MLESKCKKCRRAGEKLYLKGDKCFTPKCPFIERPYAPGMLDSQKKHRSPVSEYGQQLKEKQKIRNVYGVSEKQFSNYIANLNLLANKHKVTGQLALIISLESRLDNVVYKMGLATSRSLARQIVSHGHITVNGKKLDVPSYSVKNGDVIAVREGSKNSKLFTMITDKLKDVKNPSWMTFDSSNLSAVITDTPNDTDQKFDLNKVLEFYSR
ncbi:MAG: small subunit ribosomal protein [Patescibacteria group bacterium]|nr:small subunit ribosomal protein [Patescibacteria group bacterium]